MLMVTLVVPLLTFQQACRVCVMSAIYYTHPISLSLQIIGRELTGYKNFAGVQHLYGSCTIVNETYLGFIFKYSLGT